jgi:CSLREA domain-containing protein
MKRLTVLLVSLAALAGASPAHAVVFNVTTTDDEANAADCNPPGGPDCALREAIIAANDAVTTDVVNVQAGEYLLTIPPGATNDDGLDGDLDILDEMTLAGAGAAEVTISAGGDGGIGDRVLDTPFVVGSPAVTISGVTVTGGRLNNDDGGGISAKGPTTVDGVVMTDNVVVSSTGGGIVNDGDELLTIRNSVVSDNSATQGGGIAGDGGGRVDIFDSRVIRNRAEGNDTSYGGGILEDGGNIVNVVRTDVMGNTVDGYLGGGIAENGGGTGSGTVGVSIRDSLIADNHVTDPDTSDTIFATGGGVGEDGGANVEIVNSTISGNSVQGSAADRAHGGGIGETGGGTVSLVNVTLADNTADGSGGNAYTNSDPVTFKNSIVSGGGADSCTEDGGTITSTGHNIDRGSSCGFGSSGDQSNTDPLLAPLADNGGFTQTRALQGGSPAIDSADGSACPATDQRGVARPQFAGCDKGAFELAPAPPPASGPAAAAAAADPPCDSRARPRAGAATRVGTARADVMAGTSGPDLIRGAGGNDRISGLLGNDCLFGEAGNDRLFGNAGRDFLIGGVGADRLNGAAGNDRFSGGRGNDTLIGGSGRDRLSASAGRDRLSGGTGNDTLFAGSGNDRGSGGSGNDRLSGSTGHDSLSGGSGRDLLIGWSGNDRLSGGRGNDTLRGYSGNDRLTGGPGRDRLLAGPGDDVIRARDGARDEVRCGAGTDRVTADAVDRLIGCQGARR